MFRIYLFTVLLAIAGFSQLPAVNSINTSMDFEKSAKKNSILMNSLSWKWGRPQRGWYLYVPLISRTLKTEHEADSKEFAAEVARWQRDAGLGADGVIDRKTLFSFIDHWQSKRLRPLYIAQSKDLLTAPIADFYDPTRDLELLKIDKDAFAAYKELIVEAEKALAEKNGESGRYLSIISSYRSPAYQAELRRKEPGATRAQLARKSPHFTGRALDIYVGGEPVTTEDANRAKQIRTEAYLWLVNNAEKFGFYPYFYEPWHWEYVGR